MRLSKPCCILTAVSPQFFAAHRQHMVSNSKTTPKPARSRDRYELLHQWRKRRAKARGVESDVILPRDALWELARRNPRSLADLAALEHLGPWRREAYGPELLEVLSGS